MGKKKIYVVKGGTNPGIYDTWDECKKYTQGISGTTCKGFTSRNDAEAYLGNDIVDKETIDENEIVDYDKLVLDMLRKKRVVAFTDGGYDNKAKIAGYGAYILEPAGEKPIEISDVIRTTQFQSSNNIAPEVMAVISALDWTISNNYEKITIFHDYDGIGKWGRKEWNAKSEIAKWYINKLESTYNDILDINYIWVPGHSNVTYNEEADRLATEAINKNTKPRFKMSESYFRCQSVSKADTYEIIETIKKVPDILINENKTDKSKCIYSLSYKKEKLTVSFFYKNSITLVQGKPNSLFSLFVSYYTEKIPDFNLVKVYSDMHKSTIEFSKVNTMIKDMKLPDDYPKDAIKLIMQALAEKIALAKNSYIEAYDYSHYIFPACRSLEGTIKYLFEKAGIHIARNKTIGGYFQKNQNGFYELKGNSYDIMYKAKIEKVYNTYYHNRHALGHFGELLNNDEYGSTTMMIETQEDAKNILDEILEIIKFD